VFLLRHACGLGSKEDAAAKLVTRNTDETHFKRECSKDNILDGIAILSKRELRTMKSFCRLEEVVVQKPASMRTAPSVQT